QNLERKVDERTDELNQTLTQVQKLKESQDGDYFLTSLLIHPLAQLKTTSNYVAVTAYSNQKKKFTFNQRQAEIGGDISIAEQIRLRDKPYTVFINADAMGKSIQGAGGALVVGTVFHALLGRTHSSSNFQQLPPELWLREAYYELQDVFCTFDGNMLSSAAIGLIEEEKGTLYYINAEHPTTVLFRNGKASFVEEEPMFYKFGIDLVKPMFSVIVKKLEPGDILILGSDGRDDIILKDGTFNIDSNLFLKSVEQGNANLNKIANSIQSYGSITDDLTLLRVGYKENKNDTATSKTSIESLLNQEKQALELVSQQKYSEALSIFKAIFAEDPVNTEALYWISYIQAQTSQKRTDLKQAAITGEQVRCRIPEDTRNLEHLIRCYQRLNSPLIKSVAEDLLSVNPNSQKAKQVLA
ncbi:MAG: serine/threonine-protein phosphatase, partial [Leptonema sp. (in: Bacteria)]|nr:serine/threonine-protein phosphatase [Leptonema sp. (in: bacteria)]